MRAIRLPFTPLEKSYSRLILGSRAAFFTDRRPNRTRNRLEFLNNLDLLFKRQVGQTLPPLLFRAKEFLDGELVRIESLATHRSSN